MSLAIAVQAHNGVVLATDSRASTDTGRFTATTDKIYRVGEQPILISGTGHGGVIGEGIARLQDAPPLKSLRIAKSEIGKRVRETLREARESVEETMGQAQASGQQTRFLMAGVFGEDLAIIEVPYWGDIVIYGDGPGTAPDLLPCIGGPEIVAQTVAMPYVKATLKMDIRAAKILAFRIIDESITYCGNHLGGPVNLQYVIEGGGVGRCDDEELARFKTICDDWRSRDTATWEQIASGD